MEDCAHNGSMETKFKCGTFQTVTLLADASSRVFPRGKVYYRDKAHAHTKKKKGRCSTL
jgi:hypothetical protein